MNLNKEMMTVKCPYGFCDFRDDSECVDNPFGCLKTAQSKTAMKGNTPINKKEDAENPIKSRRKSSNTQ